MHWLMVAAGGALGAMMRFGVYTFVSRLDKHAALATVVVNAGGSFLAGAAFVLLVERSGIDSHLRSLLIIGLLGAFTTYSTYSLDALGMFQNGQYQAAIAYLLGTLLLCMLMVALGVALARLL